MAATYHCIVMLAFFSTFGNMHAAESFPENNPLLGIYQNEANCFPFQDTWYIIYRSFEYDPYLGGSPACIAVSESGPFENGSGQFSMQIGSGVPQEATATLMSSPGYEVKNVINVAANGAPEVNYNLTSVFVDCGSCEVVRHSYADGGKGCALWQPKGAIGTDITCCQFIYDLVCGTSTKYQLYENCQ